MVTLTAQLASLWLLKLTDRFNPRPRIDQPRKKELLKKKKSPPHSQSRIQVLSTLRRSQRTNASPETRTLKENVVKEPANH